MHAWPYLENRQRFVTYSTIRSKVTSRQAELDNVHHRPNWQPGHAAVIRFSAIAATWLAFFAVCNLPSQSPATVLRLRPAGDGLFFLAASGGLSLPEHRGEYLLSPHSPRQTEDDARFALFQCVNNVYLPCSFFFACGQNYG